MGNFGRKPGWLGTSKPHAPSHACRPHARHMTIAARTIISVLLIAGLAAPAVAADFPRKAPVRPANVADLAPRSNRRRGRRRFPAATFSASPTPPTSAIPASGSFASENTGFAGKRDGSFLALFSKSQFTYTYSRESGLCVLGVHRLQQMVERDRPARCAGVRRRGRHGYRVGQASVRRPFRRGVVALARRARPASPLH